MRTVVASLVLFLALMAPARACENYLTDVDVTLSGSYDICWTAHQECPGTLLYKVEAQCCDGGGWITIVNNYAGTCKNDWFSPGECDTGWRFRVTMVQGCTQSVCYIETACY